MSMTLVKNVMTRFQARMYRTKLKKYLQGMFICIGDRKIPPTKECWIRNDFKSQINLLADFGLITILRESDDVSPLSYVPVTSPASPIRKSIKTQKYTTNVVEEDDFIIISTTNQPLFEDEKPAKLEAVEAPLNLEVTEEVKEHIDEIKAELKEEIKVSEEPIKEVAPEPMDLDTKIINEMKKMVEEKDGLTVTGKPGVDRLNERLGIVVNTKTRNRLLKELEK